MSSNRRLLPESILAFVLVVCVSSIGCSAKTGKPSHPERSDSEPASQPFEQSQTEADETTINESVTSHVRSLQIRVAGFAGQSGQCMIAIYGSPVGFNNPDQAIAKQSFAIDGDKAVWDIDLPLATASSSGIQTPSSDRLISQISVSAYHDANSNGKLDKNSFGLPTERYGFSNSPKRGFGPPKFQETAIELAEASDQRQVISIEVK